MQPALKRAIIAFVLASIVLVSFAALMQQQKSFTFSITPTVPRLVQVYSEIPSLRAVTTDPYCLLAFPTASFSVSNASRAPFNNGTRTQIYNYIEGNPGVIVDL